MKLIHIIMVASILMLLMGGSMAAKSGPIEMRTGATITGQYQGSANVQIYQWGLIDYAKAYDGSWVYLGTSILSDNLAVFNASRDYCKANYPWGATIEVMNGNFTFGTFQFLYSNLTIHLNKGVTIRGSTTVADYPRKYYGFPSYTDNYVNTSMFWAQDVSNIALVGEGTIDGQGNHANYNLSEHGNKPYLIRFCNVSQFRVSGGSDGPLRLMNSAMWAQHYLNCSNGAVENMYIRPLANGWTVYKLNGNRDGLVVDCSNNITVSKIDAFTQDDAICLKASGPLDCADIIISDSTVGVKSIGAGVKLGTESNGGFVNILVTNININNAPVGFGIMTVDGGNSKNIVFDNINMNHVGVPFYVRLGNRNRSYGHGTTVAADGTLQFITMRDITAYHPRTATPAWISGYGAYATKGIFAVTLDNFKAIGMPGGGTAAQSTATIPELTATNPSEVMFGALPALGLYVRHVYNSRFINIDINVPLTNDDRPVAVFSDVGTSTIDGMMTYIGTNALARVFLNATYRVQATRVSGSSGVLFRINNSATQKLSLIGNDNWGTLESHGSEVTASEIHSWHNPD
jgi:hypothetical protein